MNDLLRLVTAAKPSHIHVDECTKITASNVIEESFAVYNAAVGAIADANAALRVVPMLSFQLESHAPTTVPDWDAVAREVMAGDEPPAVYFIDAAAFRARPATPGQPVIPLATRAALPDGTRVEYRASPSDDGWVRRIVVFPA